MDDLPYLEDADLLWDVIKPVLQQYNPSDRCVGSMAANIVGQIFVQHGINRNDFLEQMIKCYDLHYDMWVKRVKQHDG